MGQEITLPEQIKVEVWSGFWTRQDAIDNPDKLFLFGGNILQDYIQTRKTVPYKTQAVIRGLINTLAINTKWSNGSLDTAYFSDQDAAEFGQYLLKAQLNLEHKLREFKIIVLPSKENGIGTGTAYLQQKAPKCWELLQEFLKPLYERAETSS
jgi:hypothetical protein